MIIFVYPTSTDEFVPLAYSWQEWGAIGEVWVNRDEIARVTWRRDCESTDYFMTLRDGTVIPLSEREFEQIVGQQRQMHPSRPVETILSDVARERGSIDTERERERK